MRIAYVTPRYAPDVGGVEHHVAELAGHAARAGWEVEILAQTNDRALPLTQRSAEGALIRRFPMAIASQNYGFSARLALFLRRHARNYDLIHAHNYHALPALFAARTVHGPFVVTPHYHGTGHTAFRSFLHRFYRLAGTAIFGRADEVICVSAAEAENLQAHFPWVGSRVTVVPNGVDREKIETAEPFHVERPVVLVVGRLEAYKNVDVVLKTLAELPEEFLLVVVGDGTQRPHLERLSRDLQIQNRVRLLGRVPDAELLRWLRTATVCVNMSRHEAFGLTLAEALAAGAGVVASNIPAHAEVVRSSGADRVELVPSQASPATIAALIRRIAALERGPCTSPHQFSWGEVAEATFDVYRRAISQSMQLRTGLPAAAGVAG
jgi:glycosyltransferase involved in cell wall biosynthesis